MARNRPQGKGLLPILTLLAKLQDLYFLHKIPVPSSYAFSLIIKSIGFFPLMIVYRSQVTATVLRLPE